MTDWERKRHEDAKLAYAALMKHYPFELDAGLDGEIWEEIVGYENYRVSNFGRVYSLITDKILATSFRGKYLCVNLTKDGKQKKHSVHRLVAEAFIPNPDGKPQVNHIDGNKSNNAASNLEWCTRSENMRHAHAIGLQVNPQGEKHKQAKLTNEQALYVRDNPDKLTQKQLAKMFDVARETIGQIQRGEKYANAGGTIRKNKPKPPPPPSFKIPPEERVRIRCRYKPHNRKDGANAIAREFGLNVKTILTVIHETD